MCYLMGSKLFIQIFMELCHKDLLVTFVGFILVCNLLGSTGVFEASLMLSERLVIVVK